MTISPPSYTQIPNTFFDYWLPKLSDSEFKVLCIIGRKTFGWHKKRDKISNGQLATLTGMSEETVVKAAKALEKKGIIIRELSGPNGRQSVFYELVVKEDSNISYPPESTRGDPPGSNPPVKTPPTKEKKIQKKLLKENLPPLTPPKSTPAKAIPASPAPAAEEEDFSAKKEKQELLAKTNLSLAQQKRLMIFPLKQLEEAIEIASQIKPKKQLVNLLFDILRNPGKYEKQDPFENLTEQQRLALQHNEEIRNAGFTKGVDENAVLIREKGYMKLFGQKGEMTQSSLNKPLEELRKDIIESRIGLEKSKPKGKK